MVNRMRLYVGLLVLGLAMVVVGAGLLVARPSKIDIPDEPPIVSADVTHIMGGVRTQLFLYDDGSIIYVEETGLRPAGARATRTWRKGAMADKKGMLALITRLKSDQFSALNQSYLFQGPSSSDLIYRVTVNLADHVRTVTAFGYMSPDGGATYPDMPDPLDDIYVSLRSIALETKVVATQRIRGGPDRIVLLAAIFNTVILAAIIVLSLVFVGRDARRRGLSWPGTAAWTALSIFTFPIGFGVYFLCRPKRSKKGEKAGVT